MCLIYLSINVFIFVESVVKSKFFLLNFIYGNEYIVDFIGISEYIQRNFHWPHLYISSFL